MDKGKLIPVILIIILAVSAIGIFSWNKKNDKSKYSKLVITYQENDTEYDNLKVDKKITIEDVNFYISAVQKDLIVLRTDRYVMVNLKNSSEFKIDVNEYVNVCFSEGNCADFKLA